MSVMLWILEIPAQVWFLLAGGAVCALLADTAVRSWRAPERVADPSTMWPRPAPLRSDRPIGPRLPGGSFRMPEPGLRLAYGPGGSYFQDTRAPWFAAPDERAWVRPTRSIITTASPALAPSITVVPESGSAFWSRLEGGADVEHEGATEAWSPLNEHAAADEARLPLDDVDEWLAERVRQFEHELSRIDCRVISLVKGERCRTLDDEFAAFVAGSQQLHEYRMLRIGDTGEFTPRQHAQLEALRLAHV